MKKHLFFYLVLSILVLPLLVPALSHEDTNPELVDYIFCNGKIITIDELNTQYEAIVIDDGIIVDLGTTEEILSTYETEDGPGYDLDGRTIMPGIIDGHSHYMASLFWVGDTSNIYDAQTLALGNGYTTLN
ncbi:MAG: hypothetical protein KAS52_06455, partial [Candidatus Heimdallarchaeota archaeon]|nr:hypothetical protein [Candidatus Heimdallarchaeota archaeon]